MVKILKINLIILYVDKFLYIRKCEFMYNVDNIKLKVYFYMGFDIEIII